TISADNSLASSGRNVLLARGIGLIPAHSERLAHLSDQGSRPLRRKVTCGDNGLTDRPGHRYVFSRRSNAKPRTTASSPKRARTLSTACSASAARPSTKSAGSAPPAFTIELTTTQGE